MLRSAGAWVLLMLVGWTLLPQAAAARPSVLVIFDEDKDFPGLAIINQSLQETFRQALDNDVEFHTESLNLSQFRDASHDEVLRAHFASKYAGRKLDLVVAVMGPSLDFVARHGATLFAGVPVVFCGADASDVASRPTRPETTGVVVKRTFAPTVEVALRLRPGTREVFVVGGASEFDWRLLQIARGELSRFQDRLRITWLTAMPMDALVARLAHLPPGSVVLFVSLLSDGAGRAFIPHDALARVAQAANAPVFGSVDQYVGHGVVGGHVYSVSTHGRDAANIGLRVLRGERAGAIPVSQTSPSTDLFDWRQLRRWNIDESLLPPGSVVAYRTPTLWDLYKWYMVAGITLLLLQTALIAGLLFSRASRRRAEQEVRRQGVELAHALRVTTLGELTASVSHEINQPLSAIMANAQAARRFLEKGADTADVDEALADIVTETRNAAQTISRLHSLFKKGPPERTTVDLRALVDDVLALLRSDLVVRDIAVRFAPGGAVTVRGDPVQLRQVLLNVLVNAEQAIGTAREGPRQIEIAIRESKERVEVVIRDSGVGVPEEADLERIFERFVTTKAQGLGMGLAISRTIVAAHGGRIWATRNGPRGLTMHIELPR